MSKFKQFATVHCHPQSLDSASTPEAFAKREVELGSGVLTCTDHGSLAAAYQIYELAKKNNLTPVIGLEGYFRDDDCPILKGLGITKTNTVPKGTSREEWMRRYPLGTFYDYLKYYHITLGFMDYNAYKCAVRLLSKADERAELHGSERKLLFDWAAIEELASHNVTATSSCLIGMVARHLMGQENPEAAKAYFERLLHLFGDRFYVEVFPHVCTHNWVNKLFIEAKDESGDNCKLQYYPGKKLRTNAADEISAEELGNSFGKKDSKHTHLLAVKNYRSWDILEKPLMLEEAKFVQDFIQNECRLWATDGDVQAGCNRYVLDLAKKYGTKITIGDDSHFTHPGEKVVQEVRLSQQGGGGLKFHGSYHRQSSDEAWEYFDKRLHIKQSEFEGWVDNTQEWAARFKGFKFDTTPNLPTKFFPSDTLAYTKELIQRHGRMVKEPKYMERLKAELDLLHRNGTIDLLPYFFLDEEMCRLYADGGILSGPGRGCLSGNAKVLTAGGYKRLDKIDIGEKVYTHTGNVRDVTNVMKYQVNEPLVRLRTTLNYEPLALTEDHKVFAFSRDRIPQTKSWQKGRVRVFKDIEPTPSWIAAKDLRAGDLIYTPRIAYCHQVPTPFDLALLAKNIHEVTEDVLRFKFRPKVNGRRSFCLPNSFVNKVRRGYIPEPLMNNGKVAIRGMKAWKNLSDELESRGVSIDEWRLAYETKTISRFVTVDEDLAYFLGRWVGDGWIRSDKSNYIGIAFHSDDADGIEKLARIGGKYAFSVAKRRHRKKQLVQVIFYGKPIASLLRSLFPDYKNTSTTKYLGFLMDLPPALLKAALVGLIDSDGSEESGDGRPRTCLDTTSERLCEEFRISLLRLGIPSGVYQQKARLSGKYLCKPSFKVRFKWTNASDNGNWCEVLNSTTEHFSGYVYDLEVPDDHSYLTSEFAVHNSASGLSLSYLLGITHIDPLKYDLSLERFLTIDRIKSGKLPDIDQDLPNRDLLVGGAEVDVVEFEAEDGTIHQAPAFFKVKTVEGWVPIGDAVERNLDFEPWWKQDEKLKENKNEE